MATHTRTKTGVLVTGIWLRHLKNNVNVVEVLAEIDGVWRLVITEFDGTFNHGVEGPISHIVEPAGMLKAPLDWLPPDKAPEATA